MYSVKQIILKKTKNTHIQEDIFSSEMNDIGHKHKK